MEFNLKIYTETRSYPEGTNINFQFIKDGWNIYCEQTPLLEELKKCFPNGEMDNPYEGEDYYGLKNILEHMGCFYYPNDIGSIIKKIWNRIKCYQEDGREDEFIQDEIDKDFKKLEELLKQIYDFENDIIKD